MGGQGTCPSLPKRVRAEPGRQTLLVHFEAEICATCCIGMMINSSFYCTFYYFKNDITKFLWGRLEAIAPTTFWRRGRLPHRPHGVGAYGIGIAFTGVYRQESVLAVQYADIPPQPPPQSDLYVYY